MPPRRVEPNSLATDTALARVVAQRPGNGATITFEHDGRKFTARDGEPIAIALLAAGIQTLARSVKFHRPRGPSCLRAACDGCLTRVDGVPNIMACRVPAREGTRVQSQNSFPSARLDVLRVTDWFFPKLFDHHRLMVDYGTAINRTMQVFARRMAGLGTLPDADGPIPEPERLACDVLVVGAGPAGLALAATVARSGARVIVVEEEIAPGGTLRDELAMLPTKAGATVSGAEFADRLADTARSAGAEIHCDASATATFDNHTVVISPGRALLVSPRLRVFANGCHEPIGAFEDNDLPGVYTARAAARALAHGVLVGERVVIVGAAWPAAGLADAMRTAGAKVEWLSDGKIEAARGTTGVSGARVRRIAGAAEAKKFRCDALIVADDPTPGYELLGQAGVAIEPDVQHSCFKPHCAEDGSTERDDVFAVGSVRGVGDPLGAVDLADPLAAAGPVADGRRVAARVIARLQASTSTAIPIATGARA